MEPFTTFLLHWKQIITMLHTMAEVDVTTIGDLHEITSAVISMRWAGGDLVGAAFSCRCQGFGLNAYPRKFNQHSLVNLTSAIYPFGTDDSCDSLLKQKELPGEAQINR